MSGALSADNVSHRGTLGNSMIPQQIRRPGALNWNPKAHIQKLMLPTRAWKNTKTQHWSLGCAARDLCVWDSGRPRAIGGRTKHCTGGSIPAGTRGCKIACLILGGSAALCLASLGNGSKPTPCWWCVVGSEWVIYCCCSNSYKCWNDLSVLNVCQGCDAPNTSIVPTSAASFDHLQPRPLSWCNCLRCQPRIGAVLFTPSALWRATWFDGI